MFSLMGIIYGCYHIFGNTNNNKNIRVIDLMSFDKAKNWLNNGKKITIGYCSNNR